MRIYNWNEFKNEGNIFSDLAQRFFKKKDTTAVVEPEVKAEPEVEKIEKTEPKKHVFQSPYDLDGHHVWPGAAVKTAAELKEIEDNKKALRQLELGKEFPKTVKNGSYVKPVDFEGLTPGQETFLRSKKHFFVNDVIVKNGLTFFDIGYDIPLKAFRFKKVVLRYNHRVLFLQFKLGVDIHGEKDENNIMRGAKNMSELFPKIINEKLPSTLVDFHDYSDIYRVGNNYYINNFDIKNYDFIFFGFATKHSNIPYYIQKYLTKNNIQYMTYESYNLYDDKVYGLDIVNELGYDYLPTIQTIKLNKKIIDHVVNKFGFPVIVKITKLDQGKGVFKIDTLDALKNFYRTNQNTTFIQKLIPNDGDTRIILIKNKVQLVVKRQTAPDSKEFRSNVALGGKATPTTVPQHIIDMCEDISKHVDCDIIGFDILQDMVTKKYYIMEINVSPHFSTFSVVTGINIPDIICNYIVDKIKNPEVPTVADGGDHDDW